MQQQSGSKRLKHSRYISGFDGIRTIAVIGVIVYHLLPYSLTGGYLGVPIFFVVSGYLITDLLLQEYEQNGRIDIWAFYGRRMKRLYPALVTMVLTTAAYITLFQRSLFVSLKSIIWTNLLYVYNWWEIGHGQSYFDRFNGESPFTHLWSLSIEGQFYLFWPLILVVLLYVFHQRKTIFYLVMGLAVISAFAMAVLYDPANTNRVYYGTDTRMFAILLGVGLAFMWPATKLKTDLPDKARHALNAAGIASLLLIILLFFKLSGESGFTYRGGMFLFTLLSTVLVATVAHPAGVMNQVLTNRLFDWVGKRSYGIYLYQFPIMIFYEAKVTNIAAHPLMNALIETVLILVVSDLSYRYLESPTRHYHYRQLPQLIKACAQRNSRYGWRRWLAVPAGLITVIALYGAASSPTHLAASQTTLQDHIQRNQKTATKDNQTVLSKQKKAQKKVAASKYQNVKLTNKQQTVAKTYDLTKQQLLTAKDMPVTAIGDSVMVDVSTDLRQVFPNTYVMAKVGRQVWQAPSEIHGLEAKGALSHNVLINLGTNGPMTTQQINNVIQAIGPKRHIYWVTTHVPTRNWETQTNTTINQASKRFSNVTVIDWHGLSADHKSWFYNDNVHPNPTGNKYFTALVAKHLTQESS
ncbi:acyltransferase family protein [Secundilactobacillus collinoides]|uniref:Acyltransferase 3 n=1 Tax=Secundilactobacillus collinoides DSM 20515 = JCM 1123 TaxID=1423733 RepID=A0A0R2BBW0_SECCO|nr:acyltransferase family protein [Secundilactobacillus collinoides]KRM74059.1 acyltransferase 3 [Secundilactobacillus collinoides DSM 20515 = JCM 1123]